MEETKKIPSFIRIKPPQNETYYEVRSKLNELSLNTVCKEAKCPNLSECWSEGTATVMILGDVCTRGCRFCNIKTGNPKGIVDEEEPKRVAAQVLESGLKYVVITCVDRDDLSDGGASIFAETIEEIKKGGSSIRVEGLTSDYRGDENSIKRLSESGADVLAHNIETVERLTPTVRDRRAHYKQSLNVLSAFKKFSPKVLTKSSIMVGLGESKEEVIQSAKDLRDHGVDVVTFGQYLRPTSKHLKVERYYFPEEFKELELMARELGFLYVASGPLVRSSYRAAELFAKRYLDSKKPV